MELQREPPDLIRAVQACINDQADCGCVGAEAAGDLVASVTSIVNAGLRGNRAVQPHMWAIVEAMERAYPLLLSPGTEAVRFLARSGGTADDWDWLAHHWVLQGTSDGSLAFLLEKMGSQPQIASAYEREAPARSRHSALEFQAALLPLKGARFPQLDPPAAPAPANPKSQAEGTATVTLAQRGGPSVGLVEEAGAGPGSTGTEGPGEGAERGPEKGGASSVPHRPPAGPGERVLPGRASGVLQRLWGTQGGSQSRQQEGPGPPGGPDPGAHRAGAAVRVTLQVVDAGPLGSDPALRVSLRIDHSTAAGALAEALLGPEVPGGSPEGGVPRHQRKETLAGQAVPERSTGGPGGSHGLGSLLSQAGASISKAGASISKAGASISKPGSLPSRGSGESGADVPKWRWGVLGWAPMPVQATLPNQEPSPSETLNLRASPSEPQAAPAVGSTLLRDDRTAGSGSPGDQASNTEQGGSRSPVSGYPQLVTLTLRVFGGLP
eukprot:jgi/Botrbrau1/14810/Bobra.0332s0003.1